MSSVFYLLDGASSASEGVWVRSLQQRVCASLWDSRDNKDDDIGGSVPNAVTASEVTNSPVHKPITNAGLNESFSFHTNNPDLGLSSLLARILHRMLREADGITTDVLLVVAQSVEKAYLQAKETGAMHGEGDVYQHHHHYCYCGDEDVLERLIQEKLMTIGRRKKPTEFFSRDHRCCNCQGSDLLLDPFPLSSFSSCLKSNKLTQSNFATYDKIPPQKLEEPTFRSVPFISAPLTAVPMLPCLPAFRELHPIVVMTSPKFFPERQRLSVFVTIESDIFYSAGVLRCMAPETNHYGNWGEDGDDGDYPLARQPFRWFLAKGAGLEQLPRNRPLTLLCSPASLQRPGSLLRALMQQCGGDTFLPMDSLLALGIASSSVLSFRPPIAISLEIDLNPDHDLNHMRAVDVTLRNRYWALCKKSSSTLLANYACLEEGVPYVIGVEVFFGGSDADVDDKWVLVLRDFLIPGGGRTGQTRKNLHDLLNSPYRHL